MKTFVIHLSHRSDRRNHCEENIRNYFPEFNYFPAIQKSDGVLGIKQTLLSLYEYILCYSEDKHFLVFEDDALICNDIVKAVSNVEGELNKYPQASMVHLGYNLHQPVQGNKHDIIISIPQRTVVALQGVIYTRAGVLEALKLTSQYLNHRDPVDLIFDKYLKNRFIYKELLVLQKSSYSDIEKKEVNYNSFLSQNRSKNLILI